MPEVNDGVRIVEVGPRDGLQNIAKSIPTATKLELISRLHQTGLRTIELTSVVSPKAVPQLADCRDLLSNGNIQTLLHSSKNDDLRLPVLIPNLKGLQIALDKHVREIAVFVSASEGFSKANINATVEQGLATARTVTQHATKAGLAVRGYLSCIFADPFDGPTPLASVLKAVRALLDMGCYEVSLGDTLGVGTAADVKGLLNYLTDSGVPISRLAGHFHDTYGQAVSNVWQAYQCGVRVFDGSVGGLGGCPFAPGAKGNASTEDLVYLFDRAGVHTGVDLLKLAEVGTWISQELARTNDSRSGAALATKHKIQIAPMQKANKAGSNARLRWVLQSDKDGLRIYRSGVNLYIVLNRPKNGNALTEAMIANLTNIFKHSSTDPSTTRILIGAEGKFFCTGMDLGKGTSPVAQTKKASDAQYQRLTELFEAIDNAPQVTIACISGPMFGGGVGLAFACDIRIAVKTATANLSEARLGLCPATISRYVVREWGFAFTREAILSTRSVAVAELKVLGCVAVVVNGREELGKAVDGYLVALKSVAPEASRMCKDLVKLGWRHAGGQQQADELKKVFDRMMRADGEAAVGLKAFQGGKKALNWDELSQAPSKAKSKL